MGSVMTTIRCPNCGSAECFEDIYQTEEVFQSCPECGYHYSMFYKRDNAGKLIKRDETKDFSSANLIVNEIHIKKPYGAFKITTDNDKGHHCGSIETVDEYEQLRSEIEQKSRTNNMPISVEISRFVDGDFVKEFVLFK
jgi:uncharacterized Zn finger protein